MKNSLLLIAAIATLAAAAPSAPALSPFTSSAAAPSAVHHIKMVGAGEVLGDPTAPGGAAFVASGVSTMLGKWTNVGVLSIDPLTGAATGSVTFTAANGDQLAAVFSGTFDPATGTATAVFSWIGGTGRFVTASGSADFVVVQDPNGLFAFEARGNVVL